MCRSSPGRALGTTEPRGHGARSRSLTGSSYAKAYIDVSPGSGCSLFLPALFWRFDLAPISNTSPCCQPVTNIHGRPCALEHQSSSRRFYAFPTKRFTTQLATRCLPFSAGRSHTQKALTGATATWNALNAVHALPFKFVVLPPAQQSEADATFDVQVRICRDAWGHGGSLLGHAQFEADVASGLVETAKIDINACDFDFGLSTAKLLGHPENVRPPSRPNPRAGSRAGVGSQQHPHRSDVPELGHIRQRRLSWDDLMGVRAIYRTPSSPAYRRTDLLAPPAKRPWPRKSSLVPHRHSGQRGQAFPGLHPKTKPRRTRHLERAVNAHRVRRPTEHLGRRKPSCVHRRTQESSAPDSEGRPCVVHRAPTLLPPLAVMPSVADHPRELPNKSRIEPPTPQKSTETAR